MVCLPCRILLNNGFLTCSAPSSAFFKLVCEFMSAIEVLVEDGAADLTLRADLARLAERERLPADFTADLTLSLAIILVLSLAS